MRFVIIFLSPELCPLCDAVAGVEDTRGTSILGEVRNVEISRITQ